MNEEMTVPDLLFSCLFVAALMFLLCLAWYWELPDDTPKESDRDQR